MRDFPASHVWWPEGMFSDMFKDLDPNCFQNGRCFAFSNELFFWARYLYRRSPQRSEWFAWSSQNIQIRCATPALSATLSCRCQLATLDIPENSGNLSLANRTLPLDSRWLTWLTWLTYGQAVDFKRTMGSMLPARWKRKIPCFFWGGGRSKSCFCLGYASRCFSILENTHPLCTTKGAPVVNIRYFLMRRYGDHGRKSGKATSIRRHLQPHTGVHENFYFAVCIVIFFVIWFCLFWSCHLSMSFFAICVPCVWHFFLQFFIVFLHVLMILMCFLWFFNGFLWFSSIFGWFSSLIHWFSLIFFNCPLVFFIFSLVFFDVFTFSVVFFDFL